MAASTASACPWAVFDDFEHIVGGDHLLPLEDLPQDVDGLRVQLREVCQGASFDFAVFSISLAKQDSGRRVTIGNGGDIHADTITNYIVVVKTQIEKISQFTCQHISTQNCLDR